MALLPKVKLKVVPTFPSNILGGIGIETTKEHGAVTIDMAWQEFGTISAIPTSPTSNILTFDTATGTYVMVPSHLLGGAASGIADAPIDGIQYGRQSAGWTPISSAGTSFIQSGASAVTRSMQNKAREIFSVTDFGADPTGVADSAPAIMAALAALPATGGDVLFPRGTYKINSTIYLGNGTPSTNSTRYGMRLIGEGVSGSTHLPNYLDQTSTIKMPPAVKLLWGGAAGGNMVTVLGSLEGWGIHSITFDGNTTSGNGLTIYAASFGDCAFLGFLNVPYTCLLSMTYSHTGASSTRNYFRSCSFNVMPVSTAVGIMLDGGMQGNTCYATFINTAINNGPYAGGQTAIYLKACDSNSFFNTSIFNGGGANGIVFNYYSVEGVDGAAWPASNGFYHLDPIGSYGPTNYTNVGTPHATLAAPNWIYGLVTTNTAVPPNLPNLTYLAPNQLGGTMKADAAVLGAVGELLEYTTVEASAFAISTGTPVSVGNITLTPGDWDLSGIVYFHTAGTTTVYQLISSLSPPSSLLQTAGNLGQINYPGSVLGVANTAVPCGPIRISLATSQTYHLVAYSVFGVSSMTVWGTIRARRMR